MKTLRIFLILFLALFIFSYDLHAQVTYNFWVLLSDKTNSPFSFSSPEAFLSDRAIQRRSVQFIALDMKDIPVDPAYRSAVIAINGVQYRYASKWFNALAIRCDSASMLQVAALPFVTEVRRAITIKYDHKQIIDERIPAEIGITLMNQRLPIDYGLSANQIMDMNGQVLHDLGYTGQGMVMAILDSGFDNVDSMLAFADLRNEGRILSTHDFVQGDEEVYDEHSHGRYVLSTIAGIIPGLAYGTAVSASFHLLRTEDVDSETTVEEYNWIAAAEYADSAGADVLNTSLGYTDFDSLQVSYTYEDMDGNTAWITRGADIAASRGMLIVNSAGNSGNGAFHYISAPADGDSVLAVGSVNPDSLHTGFSSFGPSFDGRVKPNVCAQGFQSIGVNRDDVVVAINGTSFSSPILAGMATCLWQAVPGATNMEVFNAIQMSADHYSDPNDSLGYGIPNFGVALELLQEMVGLYELESSKTLLFPNPVQDQFQVLLEPGMDRSSISIQAIDMKGSKLELSFKFNSEQSVQIDAWNLSMGMYTLIIQNNTHRLNMRFIKE